MRMLTVVVISPQNIVWRYIVLSLSCDFQNIVEISLSHFFWEYHTIFNHEILVYFSLSIDLWKLNDYKFHMVWHIAAWIGVFCAFFLPLKNDFMCIVRTFHEFHDNVAFPAIYAHFWQNRTYCKYRVIISYIV